MSTSQLVSASSTTPQRARCLSNQRRGGFELTRVLFSLASTGDIFRYNIKNKTPIGKKAKTFIDAGKLVPDEVVLDMVKDAVSTEECRTKGWLLDGFPRTAFQVRNLR